MKTTHFIFVILAFSISSLVEAQNKDVVKTDKSTAKTDNLLDMQTNVLTNVFGENLDGNSQGKSIGYLELLDKMDKSQEQKAQMKNIYYLQAKELNQKTKDSLGKALEQKIMEAQQRED